VAHLLVARESAAVLVLSSRGRAFRVPVDSLPLTEMRGRGTSLPGRLMLTNDETIGALLALDDERDGGSNLLIATASGWVRSLHRNYVGPRLQPGTLLSDPRRGGPPAAMALSDGEGDLLVATRSGLGYRFSERLLRREGVSGIQVRPGDALAGIASIGGDEDDVLLVTGDGQGARRNMGGFSANKSPGGQGKILMKTDALAGLARVTGTCEAMCASGLAKVIRFAVDEVPAKSGSVQGVNVMDCRSDSLTAMAVIHPPHP
jgi:DNA gyrase/topoisomerase IV subunit A